MTLGGAIKFWLSIGCFTQEYMENITVALRFFVEYTYGDNYSKEDLVSSKHL